MSAGVSDQRMKGQGNQVTNVPKEQQLESGGEELAEASWRHQQQQQPQQPSYAPPISSADHYNTAAGYYGTTGTAAFPYQAFGVGDGTWSTNGTDAMPFLGGYNPHDSYGMDGVFGPSTTFSTAAFGQPASNFNYFHGNGDFSAWGQLSRAKHFDDYYRTDGLYMPDGIKAVETGVQGLSLVDNKQEKDRLLDIKESMGGAQPKKTTWASIASQPAKPTPPIQLGGLKKKGPGMPPPPIIPGKHNMDIGTWDVGKSPPVVSQPPPPQPQPPPAPLPRPMANPAPPPPPVTARIPPPAVVTSRPPPTARPVMQPAPTPAWMFAVRPTHPEPYEQPVPHAPQPPPPAPAPQLPHPVLDELRVKNDYNPHEFDLSAPDARFFVIKSYSEDDIHRSIKYEIWCSTEHGNQRLDGAFRERERERGYVYLFFSVNSSGHFCGMARMMSPVDYNSNSSVWAQDKWKGQFRVKWIYVKDVPNVQLRHIKLENNDNKPVTNSRDTQEVPHAKGLQVLRIMHGYCHSTSIFDDFIHYEKRQEEEDQRKPPPKPMREESEHGGRGHREPREHREYRDNREHGGQRDNREHGGPREHGGSREHREPRENREHGGPRDNREHRDPRDNRDHGGPRDNRDHGGPRDSRDHREPRDHRDHRDHRDRDGRDNREGRDHRDGRDHYRPHRDSDSNYRPHPHKERGDNGGRGRGRSRN